MHPVIQQIYKQKCLPLPSPIQPLRGLRYNSGLTDGLVHQRAPLYLCRQIKLLSSSDVFLSIGGINKNKPKQTNKTQTDKNNQKKKNTRKKKGCFTSVVGSRAAETDFRAISGVSLLHKCRGHLIQTVHGPFVETRNDTPAPFSFLFFLLHVFALFYVGRGLKTTSWQKAEPCSYCKA